MAQVRPHSPRARAAAPAYAVAALLVAGSAVPAPAAANEALDAAFARLWAAATDQETAGAVEAILATGADAGEVRARLRAGRPYAPAPTGRQALSRRNRDGVEHPYIVHVPAGYDPAAPLPLRVYLHGGVMRPLPDGDGWWRGEDRWVRDDAIVVAPASWNGSPWWRRSQIENLAGLLADLKRRYNIDENRVHLLGVSDGATGAYYHAFKAATPWAACLAFIGHPAVLGHPGTRADGEMHVVNLRGKPLFIINGARDRLYPAALIEPVRAAVRRCRRGRRVPAAGRRRARPELVGRGGGAHRGVHCRHRPQPAAGRAGVGDRERTASSTATTGW